MKNIPITIVCPLFNGRKYIEYLNQSINEQTNVLVQDVLYVVTKTNDGTEEYLDSINAKYITIEKNDFSYSLTREKILYDWVDTKYAIMISQDIKFTDSNVFSRLIDRLDEKVVYVFSRQISDKNNIEKYIRNINYPSQSYTVTINDVSQLGLKAFFASDVCCALDRDVFLNLKGYDNLKLPINQEMYYSKKLLENNYAIGYCADSKIIHYHDYKLKDLYRRYFTVGEFFAYHSEFKKYKAESVGLKLAFKVFISAIKEFNISVLFRLIPDMLARYLGKRNGEKSASRKIKKQINT